MSKPVLKLIVFSMGSLKLAVPIESVYKVFNQPSINSSGVNQFGVTHVGEQQVTVVDLYRRVFKQSQTNVVFADGYLVTVQNSQGELYGIAVTDTPVLMDVLLSSIRVLPESYRRVDTLDLASHVVVIPQESGSITVFLLDVDLLLPI
ncbi:chemotaxis protein CheW [Lyngbya aestuarii]|uniref:chemotaxis protein CheW n=1 Tax=Lyngbya aestuarii TaxID=118322 RepID=UPI00403E216B